MNKEIIFALLGGSGAMLGWGCYEFFAKKSIDKIGDVVTLFWIKTIGTVITLIYYFFNFSPPVLSLKTILLLLIFGVSYMLVCLLYYIGFKKGQASIVSPVFASYTALTVPISFFFFGERISFIRWGLLAAIFIGIILTVIDFKGLKDGSLDKKDLVKGLPETLLGLLIFAVWYPFWDKFISQGNWLFLTVAVRIIMILSIYLYAKRLKISLQIKTSKLKQWLTAAGLLEGLAFLSLNWGFSASSFTSITTMASGAYSLPTLILARIFLKEKLTKIQSVGVLTIIIGIVLIAGTG